MRTDPPCALDLGDVCYNGSNWVCGLNFRPIDREDKGFDPT